MSKFFPFQYKISVFLGTFPDGVLCQPDFESCKGVSGTRSGVYLPFSLWVEPDITLWVADYINHRALRFDYANQKPNGKSLPLCAYELILFPCRGKCGWSVRATQFRCRIEYRIPIHHRASHCSYRNERGFVRCRFRCRSVKLSTRFWFCSEAFLEFFALIMQRHCTPELVQGACSANRIFLPPQTPTRQAHKVIVSLLASLLLITFFSSNVRTQRHGS